MNVSKSSPSIILAVSLLCLCVFKASASATENEFEPCQQKAVKVLRYCLEAHNANSNKHCWAKSQQGYQNCAREVKKRHDPEQRQNRQQSAQQAELKYKLDKKLKPNKIKVRLMAAANLQVYRQVLEQVLSDLETKQALVRLNKKQQKAASEREQAYQQFLTLVEQRPDCESMKDQIGATYGSNASKVGIRSLPKAAREIANHIPSYCRLL